MNSHRWKARGVPPPRPVLRSSSSAPSCFCSSQVCFSAFWRCCCPSPAILFGASLAIAAWPLRDFLLRCGLKRGLAATLLLLLALAVIALPLMAVAPSLAEHLTKGADRLQD